MSLDLRLMSCGRSLPLQELLCDVLLTRNTQQDLDGSWTKDQRRDQWLGSWQIYYIVIYYKIQTIQSQVLKCKYLSELQSSMEPTSLLHENAGGILVACLMLVTNSLQYYNRLIDYLLHLVYNLLSYTGASTVTHKCCSILICISVFWLICIIGRKKPVRLVWTIQSKDALIFPAKQDPVVHEAHRIMPSVVRVVWSSGWG